MGKSKTFKATWVLKFLIKMSVYHVTLLRPMWWRIDISLHLDVAWHGYRIDGINMLSLDFVVVSTLNSCISCMFVYISPRWPQRWSRGAELKKNWVKKFMCVFIVCSCSWPWTIWTFIYGYRRWWFWLCIEMMKCYLIIVESWSLT